MGGHEQTRGTGNQKIGVNLEKLEDSVILEAKIMEAWRHESRSLADTRFQRNGSGVVLLNE